MTIISNESAIISLRTYLQIKIFVAPPRTKVHPMSNSLTGSIYAGVAQLDRAMVF